MSEIKTQPKRLVDLNPVWLNSEGSGGPQRSALEFDCPCGLPPGRGEGRCSWARVYVPIAGRSKHSVTWKLVCGEDLTTLTLSPSLHLVGHWHGWLKSGVLTSC